MKRKALGIMIIIAIIICVTVSSCTDDKDERYSLIYTDEEGTHVIRVEHGEIYTMESIPSKAGFEFIGLFDAEVGGTMFVDEKGMCVSPFYDDKNMVLYPQFKPMDIIIYLDYGSSSMVYEQQIVVEYGGLFPELPTPLLSKDPSLEFRGWYTAEDCQGIQVADEFGLLPSIVAIDDVFDLDESMGNLYLYAGFKHTPVTVTFFPEPNGEPIIKTVEYGTLFSDIDIVAYSNSRPVLKWSQSYDANNSQNIFSGRVESNVVLYPAVLGYTITYISNGGSAVSPSILAPGSSIVFPTPQRSGYKFLYWQTVDGQRYDESVMPANDFTLIACWERTYSISFVNNGGSSSVSRITETAGTSISLPRPTKSGQTFDGWYTSSGERYASTVMPANNLTLYARWCGDFTVDFTRYSCKDANGYNISDPSGDSVLKARHNGFELGEILINCASDNNGNYFKPNASEIALKFYITSNIDDLPRTDDTRNGLVHVEDDGYSGSVSGTNISGKRIGNGAYYIRVYYTDGTYTESSAVNFLANYSQYDYVNMSLSIDSRKAISRITVDIMYELYHGAPGFLEIIWWHDYSNWRLKGEFTF